MIFLKTTEPELNDKAQAALYRAVDGFVRAGGRPTIEEWRRLDSCEQEAMVAVRRAYDIELAFMSGLSAQGPKGAAQVISEVDKGELRMQLVLEASLERGAARLRGIDPRRKGCTYEEAMAG